MCEYPNIKYVMCSRMPKSLAGVIIQDSIYLNSNRSARCLYATLAEELGHWETSPDCDITNYKKNGKDELRAREWSYEKVIPLSDFLEFQNGEAIADYYISDELDLPLDIVQEAFEMYKRKGAL